MFRSTKMLPLNACPTYKERRKLGGVRKAMRHKACLVVLRVYYHITGRFIVDLWLRNFLAGETPEDPSCSFPSTQ